MANAISLVAKKQTMKLKLLLFAAHCQKLMYPMKADKILKAVAAALAALLLLNNLFNL